MDVYDVVVKLIGPTIPVGDSWKDELRLANLKELTELVDCLIDDIYEITKMKDCQEASIRMACEHAANRLNGWRDWLDECDLTAPA